jgi:hypothetical protein
MLFFLMLRDLLLHYLDEISAVMHFKTTLDQLTTVKGEMQTTKQEEGN